MHGQYARIDCPEKPSDPSSTFGIRLKIGGGVAKRRALAR